MKQYRPMNVWQEEREFLMDFLKDSRRKYIKRWREKNRLRLVAARQSRD